MASLEGHASSNKQAFREPCQKPLPLLCIGRLDEIRTAPNKMNVPAGQRESLCRHRGHGCDAHLLPTPCGLAPDVAEAENAELEAAG